MKAVVLLSLLLPVFHLVGDEAADRHFTERVKLLLDSRCVSCHGPDKQKGRLRMDSRSALLKGGENGPALVPGKPTESLLVKAILHSKPDLEMPPKEKLTSKDIAVLERWISDGAPWPVLSSNAAEAKRPTGERLGDAWSDSRNPIVKIFGGQRLDLWSFKPLHRPALPAVRQKDWVKNAIDSFLLARQEAAGLTPSPRATSRELVRRLYFDLTGLPPTPGEMEEALRDQQANAYERLVDRLLSSSRYGEQAARAWLDVIRYSDSNGFDWDEFRPRAWRFRDYVIRSFNADKPFNRFILEQLAGDELLNGSPGNSEDQDTLIATGYLRLGPHDNSAPSFNEQDRSRAELMADLVETTGSAFLGLTLSCCRCHDHKYDPLSQADHYRLRAFFEPVKFADELPLDLEPQQESIRKHNEEIEAKLKPLREERDALLGKAKERLRGERLKELSSDDRLLLDLPKEKRNEDQKSKFEALEKKVTPSDKEVQAGLSAGEKSKHESLSKNLEAGKKENRAFTTGFLMTDGGEKPSPTRILFQGNHKDPRDAVDPGFLSALDPNPAALVSPTRTNSSGRRLTLAQWVISPTNPFTARVLVNRVWQGHFGRGLVETANDFGLAGARPSHPELLDWLATEFIRQGWSLKKLHRLMVTSAAYQQRVVESSDKDERNELLTRQNLRRLSAEQLRDALLAVSGTLQDRSGGPPVWPELPADILQANPAFLDDNAEKTKGWYPSTGPERKARSIYLIQKKTVRVPFMETFDLPENSVSCARRNESIVAPQALSLLNSKEAVEAAQALASRVEREAGRESLAQVNRAFELALQRLPNTDEQRACLKLLGERSLKELCRVMVNLNEFVYLD